MMEQQASKRACAPVRADVLSARQFAASLGIAASWIAGNPVLTCNTRNPPLSDRVSDNVSDRMSDGIEKVSDSSAASKESLDLSKQASAYCSPV